MKPALLSLAWKSLANRAVSVTLTVATIALSVALFLGVERVRDSVRDSFNSTISETDLIVGARSGAINLLLYSVFHLGDPTANISWDSYELIDTAPDVSWTVPISLGDSHRGYRVVGTTPGFFEHYKYGRARDLEMREGRAFGDGREAVVGAEVARQLGYGLGNEILLSHGIGEVSFAEHSDHDFRIVGILAPTGTPVDRSVLVSLESIEAIHAGWNTGAAPRAESHGHEDGEHELMPDSVTAVLVGLDSPIRVLSLQRQINTYEGEALSAVLPGVALSQLWRVVGVAERAFFAVSVLVIVVGLCGILTALSAGLNERRREMAVLRAVGARASDVFFLLILEAMTIAFLGALVGIVIATGGFAALSPVLSGRYGFDLPIAPGWTELAVLGGLTVTGALFGLWPAWRALRNALVDGLSIRI
ncbi:ABC transporter permease [Hyphobacterium sp. SN044]|uniref:ABC transporter permease n=1 Tax=Hyphobacterium sp. SN044 TaxID=2912575 RepID=UPI001F260BBF|nr:ABC transporter permease [Hyphobacterium sp. SN044]MCF8880257.1 ABC transporter permease [Hyphobacterium sp. SN044]